MNDERKGSRPALHIGVAGASLGSASAEGRRPGQGQNVEIELARCALPRILCRRRSGGEQQRKQRQTRNTALVMTTPHTRSTNVKTLDKTNQEQIFSAYSYPSHHVRGQWGLLRREPQAGWKPSRSAPSLRLAHGRHGTWPYTAYSRTSPSSRRRSS